jgi:membrane protein DedA with SNARE-associated domain
MLPDALISYIVEYGYLTIFSLVFLQEIGIPNPVPNELILLFSGYLSSIGQLSFEWVIITVIIADFVGTTSLYFAFYHFGKSIKAKKPRWFPLEKVEKLGKHLSGKGRWSIYVGRLMPFLRGYISVAAGILQIKPKIFLPAVLFSALTWSGGYVILGRVLGKNWDTVSDKLGSGNAILLLIFLIIILFVILPRVISKKKEKTL